LKEKNIIVLFDGVCNLCNGFVNFIIKRDKKSKIKFAALQSTTAEKILQEKHINTKQFNSVIVVIDNNVFTKSSAALMICKELGGVWKLLIVFTIIPKFIRDFFYNLIAKNRYKFFGKKDVCMIPNKEIVSRFIKD
jgi:predicted DCC family thiol-disulfide oxidoreductase YuxK